MLISEFSGAGSGETVFRTMSLSMRPFSSVHVIDSHTAGEPTRVVIEGGPDLGRGTLTERLACFRDQYDFFRSGVVNEPRGSDVVVGAILLEPFDPTCEAAVIYFNNVGYLGMCGHGTIGLVRTLEHMGRITPGEHRIETPSGVVTTKLHASGQVTVENVPAYRLHKEVSLDVPGYGGSQEMSRGEGTGFSLRIFLEFRLRLPMWKS